mmetsp:Transcript_6996/g.7719  ORF Transcript_6996/g.7719 Transcript_6996/m.7719 type:complete len:111 (+) Transcript_6996:122-454(+)
MTDLIAGLKAKLSEIIFGCFRSLFNQKLQERERRKKLEGNTNIYQNCLFCSQTHSRLRKKEDRSSSSSNESGEPLSLRSVKSSRGTSRWGCPPSGETVYERTIESPPIMK